MILKSILTGTPRAFFLAIHLREHSLPSIQLWSFRETKVVISEEKLEPIHLKQLRKMSKNQKEYTTDNSASSNNVTCTNNLYKNTNSRFISRA